MDIRNSFIVPLSVDSTWAVLLDIRKIAPCMPGAQLLEVIDEKTYKGQVGVRLGPVALSFVGTARLDVIDGAAHRANVKAQGVDSKGRGGANAVVKFELLAVPEGTRVDIATSLNLSGSVAQYGRGVGMIQEVANQLIDQFASALRAMLENERRATAVDPASPSSAEPPPPQRPISGIALMCRAAWAYLRRALGFA